MKGSSVCQVLNQVRPGARRETPTLDEPESRLGSRLKPLDAVCGNPRNEGPRFESGRRLSSICRDFFSEVAGRLDRFAAEGRSGV